MQSTTVFIPLWAQIALAIVPVFGAVFAGIGLFLNAAQSRRANAQSRATLVAKCLERFTDDEDMQKIFYKIEYSHFNYQQDDFHGSEEERQLDKLLMHFSATALAWESGLLTRKDIAPLEYLVRCVLRNQGVIDYLEFVLNWSKRAKLGNHPYIALQSMGRVLAA